MNWKLLEEAIDNADTHIQEALFAINTIEKQKLKLIFHNNQLLIATFNNLKKCITDLQVIKLEERARFFQDQKEEEE